MAQRSRNRELCRLIGRIPVHPADYFAGTPSLSIPLPENVLLFRRTSARYLTRDNHVHSRCVLIVNNGTEGTVVINDRSHVLPPGSAILILPHQFHHYLPFSTDTLQWLFLTFETHDPQRFSVLNTGAVKLSKRAEQLLVDLITYYAPACRASTTSNDRIVLLSALLLNELVQSASRQISVHGGRASRPARRSLADQVNEFVFANMDKGLAIGDIAYHFSLSEGRLRALYREQFGMSLGRYIRSMRLSAASGLLVGTDLPVSEIAHRTGYESVFSFSRAFRGHAGQSPRQFRARRRSAERRA